MTFEELLKACSTGKMPRVTNGQISGQVVTIKLKMGDNFKAGCGVWFDNGPGFSYWFYAEEGTDKRKYYMSQLKLIE